MNTWILETNQYNKEEHLHAAPVNTIGNGLFCCRGFLEEMQEGIHGLGGIYMAGIFGSAAYKPWKGEGRELVNVPNFLWMSITINGKPLIMEEENMGKYQTSLHMDQGVLKRSYIYKEKNQELVQFKFLRFASMDNIYTAGQQLEVTPLAENLVIEVECGIRTDITNLNEVSSEPYPVQPGRKQYKKVYQDADIAVVEIEKPDSIHLAFRQKISGQKVDFVKKEISYIGKINIKKGQTAKINKLVAISLSTLDGESVKETVEKREANLSEFEQVLKAHEEAMQLWWRDKDIEIEGSEEDQLALRYNMLQLMQSCPRHTSRYSIGARGLTGEMYEGSVFWDTEMFMLPFFTLTDQDAARKLLEFRYHTLPEAKSHAKSNWFEGAMYGWQVNAEGIEQTPQGVGAYYSIHVIADIAFAILDYWNCTGDEEFILKNGLEILIETARFWASRVTKREDGYYDIMAVRGPNEYDVLVNNNLYTNMMARENFILCKKLLKTLAPIHGDTILALKEKLKWSEEELESWKEIEENLVLPYHKEMDLWLEDDTYLRRKPLDMKRAKPTAKRIIDTTIPYEALPFYQVTKQADVLHVMKNLPWHFTKEQVIAAYQFYKPQTAFDSSLAYSMFALMSARLGFCEDAIDYYKRTANLDIENVQLNTISGLHFANFGGTWQTVIFGFGGISITAGGIEIQPHLPKDWKSLKFNILYRKTLVRFVITQNSIEITLDSAPNRPILIKVNEVQYTLKSEEDKIKAEIGGVHENL